MEKPVPQARKPTLEYNDCIHYIEKKYGINTRDMGEKYWGKKDPNAQYLDFWHWLLDFHDDIHNDSYFTLLTYNDFEYYRSSKPIPDWVKSVLDKIVTEFPPENDAIEFHVWW